MGRWESDKKIYPPYARTFQVACAPLVIVPSAADPEHVDQSWKAVEVWNERRKKEEK
jgi:hypothetical protein